MPWTPRRAVLQHAATAFLAALLASLAVDDPVALIATPVAAQSTPAPTGFCTIKNDCQDHATAVEFVPGVGCNCTCYNSWYGSECQLCPIRYSAVNCSTCNAPDYTGTYPDCNIAGCPVTPRPAAACRFHGRITGGDSETGCTCQCFFNWQGNQCEYCPPQYEQVQCSNCAPGFVKATDGKCYFECTIAANCSGNARTVSGNSHTGCTCSCTNAWYGQKCDQCPENVNASAACAVCNAGYEGMPNCSRQCTISDCGNSPNVVEVRGNEKTGCQCVCAAQWTGSDCMTCPQIYNQSNCARCNEGYDGYPNCSRKCTNAGNCSGNAVNVEGTDATGCTCTCLNKWFGKTCNQCPAGFNASTSCRNCLDGFGGPNCQRICTVQEDCNSNANSAEGYAGNCTCNCRNGWRGATCDSCTPPYEGSDCDHCVSGFIGTPPDCRKNCSTITDCSAHATSVEGFLNGTCKCDCRAAWTKDQCEYCPPNFDSTVDCAICATGYEQYPNCYKKCTNQFNCSGNAKNVTGNDNPHGPGCTCFCDHKWTGLSCSICPDEFDQQYCDKCASGYTGYPNCVRRCSNSIDCNNNAVNVTGGAGNCNCTCRNYWYGSSCGLCPTKYDPNKDCNACDPNYEIFPNCYLKCTNAANCSGHAADVSGNIVHGCNCTCRNQWFGAKCDQCPPLMDPAKDCNECIAGYAGFPNCKRICTVGEDCNSHATGVSGLEGNCTCTCRNQWYGATCDRCDTHYYNETEDCGKCIDTRETYPNCYHKCTVPANCSDHADSVTGNDGPRGCTCDCRAQWTGHECQTCPPNFDASKDCAACAEGYDDYPRCSRICTDVEDCNSRASNVSGLFPDCHCTCSNAWSGDSCEICQPQYERSTNCSTCAPNYSAYSVFPNCYLTCTDTADCSSHSVNVTGNVVQGCNCTCRNEWFSGDCSKCPPLVNAAADCGECISGYEGYPDCVRTCTNVTDCSNHASHVAGTEGNCSCTCRNQWHGQSCQTCDPIYSPAADCGECSALYEDYPNCYLKCTNAANCSNHAEIVSGNVVAGCHCTCRNEWFGSNCSQCPPLVDASKDCGQCVPLYDGYPNCKRICTVAEDCNSHATGVSGLEGNCTCTCRNQWYGETCDRCDTHYYNETEDCGKCIDTRETYPNCYFKCTVPANCSDHADSVTGNDGPRGCTCDCRAQWTGNECQTCPPNYNASLDCAACAEGYDDYPRCARICTNETDCSTHASNVTGLFPDCQCTCRNAWYGDQCQYCPPGFREEMDCAACSAGYEGHFPFCFLKCTNKMNCTNHAQRVSGNTETGCNCTCRNRWNGSSCDNCPAIYDSSETADCGTCAEGYEGYPNCVRTCTISLDCSGHADNVTGVYPNCTCGCRNQWYGEKCENCLEKYNNRSDCGTCAFGYEVYPQCFRKCTSRGNCSGNARAVTGNDNTTCDCTCRTNWYGANCSQCPANMDPDEDCGACKFGYQNYPICAPLCSNADCHYRNWAVSGAFPNCTCDCQNHWNATALCGTCPKNYNETNQCLGCAEGYDEAPHCYRICDTELDCYGNAINVTGNVGPGGCDCNCRNFWNVSTNCSTCPVNYNASLDCNACADGYDDFPRCIRKCTSLLDCNNHATEVSGLIPNCTCTCRNQWQNETCDYCPPNFEAGLDCGACAKYHENYPNCTLRVSPTLEASTSYSRTVTDSWSRSLTASNTRSRGTWSITRSRSDSTSESASETGTRTTSLSRPRTATGTSPLTRTPNRTATAPVPATPSPPNTTEAPTNASTAAPETTTLPPTPNTTTFAPATTSTTAPATTTTAAPATTTTEAPAANTTTPAPNTTEPATTTPAPPPHTPTHTPSQTLVPCREEVECSGRGNVSGSTDRPGRDPQRTCQCSCEGAWVSHPTRDVPLHSRGGCSVCPERYALDPPAELCSGCASGTAEGSTFPNGCRFAAHVVGNWSLPFCDAAQAQTQGYLEALARDLEQAITQFLVPATANHVTTLATALPTAPTAPLPHACPFPLPLNASWATVPEAEELRVLPAPTNPASLRVAKVTIDKVTVVRNRATDLPVFEGEFKRVVLFDVKLEGSSLYGVDAAAECVARALTANAGALGTAVAQDGASQLSAVQKRPAVPSQWTLSNSAAYLGAGASQSCLVGAAGFTANASNVTACFPVGCGAPFDNSALAAAPAEASGGGFAWWIILAAVGGLLALVLIIVGVLRFGAPSVGQRVLPARLFSDGTKYTINFTHMDEMDQELRLMTAEREIDFDDI